MDATDDYVLEDVVLVKNPELTRKILEGGHFRCSSETTVVRRAMESSDFENVGVLLRHGRGWQTRRAIFVREIFRLTDCDLALAKTFLERSPEWNVVDEDFVISLRHTFEQGAHEVVRTLMECKIDLHVKDKFGIVLLVNAFGNPRVNVTELFENRDFDVHAQDVSGETALHCAVDNDLAKNVKYLLDRGADPNSKDCVGWTPMFVAKSTECLELLLQYGGNLQYVDKDGFTIFDSLTTISDEMARAALANLAIAEADGTPVRQVVRNRINSIEGLRVFYQSCHREIESMKLQTAFDERDLSVILGDHESASSLVNRTPATNGYVYSVLQKKLNRLLDDRDEKPKAVEVAVGGNDILDPYRSIAARIINYSTIVDLLVFLLIAFNSLRIFF